MQLVGKYTIIQHVIFNLKQAKLIDDFVLAISEKMGNKPLIQFEIGRASCRERV